MYIDKEYKYVLSKDKKFKIYRLFRNYKDALTGKHKNTSHVVNIDVKIGKKEERKILEREILKLREKANELAQFNTSSTDITFSAFADKWVQKHSINYSSSHYYTMLNIIRYLKEFFGYETLLKNIDKKTIQNMLENRFECKMGKITSKLKSNCAERIKKMILERYNTLINFVKTIGLSDTTLKEILKGSIVEKKSAEKLCSGLNIKYSSYFNSIDTLIKTRTPDTVKKYLHVLSNILTDAVTEGLISLNYAKVEYYAGLFKKRNKIKEITEENVFNFEEKSKFEKVLKKLDIIKRTFFSISLYSGARRSEVLALTWDDVDFCGSKLFIRKSLKVFNNMNDLGSKQIYEEYRKNYPQYNKKHVKKLAIGPTKNGKSRYVPMVKILEELLKEYKEYWEEYFGKFKNKMAGNFLFWNLITNNWYYPDTINSWYSNMYKKYASELPKKITLHGLRHTFVTLLLAIGIPPYNISQIVGHSSLTITLDVYGHFINDGKNYVTEMNDVFSKMQNQ